MNLRSLTIALAALLVLAGTVFLAAKQETSAWPTAASGQPSGLGAFAELLERDGYRVSIDLSPYPQLAPDDLPVAVRFDDQFEPTTREVIEQDLRRQARTQRPVDRRLFEHLQSGGSALVVVSPRDIEQAGNEAKENTFRGVVSKSSYSLTWDGPKGASGSAGSFLEEVDEGQEDSAPAAILSSNGMRQALYANDRIGPIAEVQPSGKGRVVLLRGGVLLSNRYIDDLENAGFSLKLVRMLAKPGSKVVFVEASFGNQGEYSVFTILGPWAVAMRYQAILLFLVIAFTVGIRFGAQAVVRHRARTARDLLDAMAVLLRSPRRRSFALEQVRQDVEIRLRRVLKATADQPMPEVLARAPEDLAGAYRRLQELAVESGGKISQGDAVEAARVALAKLGMLERDSRDPRSRRAASRSAS